MTGGADDRSPNERCLLKMILKVYRGLEDVVARQSDSIQITTKRKINMKIKENLVREIYQMVRFVLDEIT